MSTKSTIRCGDTWHLYQECLEDDAVYLELENIEASLHTSNLNSNVLIRLPNKLARDIGIISEDEKPSKIDWSNFNKNFEAFIKNEF